MFIALDLETTGLDPRKDKIIEIAALRIDDNGQILGELHTLINPNTPLPPLITHLTGIRDEDVATAPHWSDIAEQVRIFLGELPILGHSVQFDVNFLTQSGGLTLSNPIFDTFELAQTVLPKEPSYSLEILSEKYQLPHPNKHRAIDDTRVAIELYKFLIERIKTLHPNDPELLKKILANSEWSWAPFLEKNLETKPPSNPPITSTPPRHHSSPLDQTLQSTLELRLANAQSALIEAPLYEPRTLIEAAANAHEASGEKILVALARPEEISTDARVQTLHAPTFYRCLTQWESLVSQSRFTAEETRLIAKILLHPNEQGTRHGLALSDADYGTWYRISALPHLGTTSCTRSDCPYLKAREQAERSPILVVPLPLWIENAKENHRLIPTRSTVIAEEVEHLESTALYVLTETFTLEQCLARTETVDATPLTVLFGLLGLMVEKYAPPDAYRQQLELTKDHQFSKEWQQIQPLLQKLATHTQSGLIEALTATEERLTWITLRQDGTPMVQSCPIRWGDWIKNELWGRTKNYLLVTGFGSLNGRFKYLKNRLHLDLELEEINLANEQTHEKPLLIPHAELPNPHSPKNLGQTVYFLKEWLTRQIRTNETTNAFLLTNSIKAAEQLHHKLAPTFKEKGIDLITQGMSGGVGKMIQRARNNPEKTILMGTEKLYSAFLESGAAESLSTLFIHRLPFLPPINPIHKREEALVPDAFLRHSLPRAILRLKQFLYDGLRHAALKEIHLLDSRWEEYNGAFRESVSEFVNQ